jgi:2,3-bisphosphoglycerate-independent phosphoglycerate mutase
MKYVVLLGDGMADDPVAERGGKTPLELAECPNLDAIADRGRLGLARTVPDGMEPGSDVANMGVLGYDPKKYYSGRAAIEAAALGIRLAPGEAAFRMNLVTLGGDPADPVMADYSGGHPAADEQRAVMASLTEKLAGPGIRLVPGVSFRNLCILSAFAGRPDLKPPHDYAGRRVAELWPAGPGSELLAELTVKSQSMLKDHPVNRARAAAGKEPINSVWFWGMGRSAAMPPFSARHGKTGAVVTGVDLIRGLGRLLDMEIIDVPGATGWVDTNYEGKAAAVLAALERLDFVFLHVEAADESGHEGDLDLKIQAISDFDRRAVGPIMAGLDRFDDWRVIALPDHETPVKERGHRGGLVPFATVSKRQWKQAGPGRVFSERAARSEPGEPVDAPRLLESCLFC